MGNESVEQVFTRILPETKFRSISAADKNQRQTRFFVLFPIGFQPRYNRIYFLLLIILLLFLSSFAQTEQSKMKIAFGLCCVFLSICLSSAFPQKDGAVFSNEAIKQAQSTFLIPKDAQIQKVQEGIEVAAYENIKGDESINLFQILGDQVPPEVVSNLQAQVEKIGRQ